MFKFPEATRQAMLDHLDRMVIHAPNVLRLLDLQGRVLAELACEPYPAAPGAIAARGWVTDTGTAMSFCIVPADPPLTWEVALVSMIYGACREDFISTRLRHRVGAWLATHGWLARGTVGHPQSGADLTMESPHLSLGQRLDIGICLAIP